MVDAFLDAAAAVAGPVDLIEALTQPLPIAMICELLGVPFAERSRFNGWADTFMTSTAHTIDEVMAARDQLLEYLAELVAERRAHPTDDLMGADLVLRDEGDALSEIELVNLGLAMLVGGYETTAAQLGKSIFCLLTHPDQLALGARPARPRPAGGRGAAPLHPAELRHRGRRGSRSRTWRSVSSSAPGNRSWRRPRAEPR